MTQLFCNLTSAGCSGWAGGIPYCILICISLMADDGHLFMGSFAIFFISSWVKHLFLSFVYFLNGLLGFFILNFESNVYILDINPLSYMYFLPILVSFSYKRLSQSKKFNFDEVQFL